MKIHPYEINLEGGIRVEFPCTPTHTTFKKYQSATSWQSESCQLVHVKTSISRFNSVCLIFLNISRFGRLLQQERYW